MLGIIDFPCFYTYWIRFWDCSKGVVFDYLIRAIGMRCLTSFNFSHFDLFKNHLANLNQTWMRYFLDRSLPKLCTLTLPFHPRWLPWLLIGNHWKSSSEPLDGIKQNLVQILIRWSKNVLTPSTIRNGHRNVTFCLSALS